MNDNESLKSPALLPGQFRLDEALVLSIESSARAFNELWDEMDKWRHETPARPSDKPQAR